MNKTKDGRFIEKRILIDREILKKIISSAKIKNSLSTDRLAEILNVSSQTVRHEWLIPQRTIPLSVFDKLFELSAIKNKEKILKNSKTFEPFWGQKLVEGKLKIKKVNLPSKLDLDFAEFYGILLGDGCLFSNLRGLSITGDQILDYYYYHEFLNKLVFKLFKINPAFYLSKNDRAIRCAIYSKSIVEYLNELGFPAGFKSANKLTIPDFIFNNPRALAACIRGLMDTDGSLAAHPHSKIMIHLSITIPSLRNSVKLGLESLGIKPGVFNKGIMLYCPDKIKLFNEIVGFSNYKNIYKYNQFMKTGKVPSSKEAEMFIRAKAGI